MPVKTAKHRSVTRSDGDSTRRRILETAGRLFAERGYAAATSKMICEQARVNVAAINYHFGSRDALYRSVLKEMHATLISKDDVQNVNHSALSPREKLSALIDTLITNVNNRRDWRIRLWAREVLSPSPQLAESIDREAVPKVNIVKAILSEITGIPTSDPALLRCLLNVMAPYLLLQIVDRRIATPISGVFSQPAADLAAHMKTYALAGLDAIAMEWRGKRPAESPGPD